MLIEGPAATTRKQADGRFFTPNCLRAAARAINDGGGCALFVEHQTGESSVGYVMQATYRAKTGELVVTARITHRQLADDFVEVGFLNSFSVAGRFEYFDDGSISHLSIEEISLCTAERAACPGTGFRIINSLFEEQ